jgi:hypothetical protein
MALVTLPEAMVSGLSELELDILFHDDSVNVNKIYPHPLVTRLQSVTLRCHSTIPGLKV